MIWVYYPVTEGITGFLEEDFDWWWARVGNQGIFFYANLEEADV
jgi:hypothetical protein